MEYFPIIFLIILVILQFVFDYIKDTKIGIAISYILVCLYLLFTFAITSLLIFLGVRLLFNNENISLNFTGIYIIIFGIILNISISTYAIRRLLKIKNRE